MVKSKWLYALLPLLLAACRQQGQHPLRFKDYPELQIGFSTQNFQKALPVDVEDLSAFIDYAATEGYQFIELRDNLASLSSDECRRLADRAKQKNIDVIYEIQVNPLDTVYRSVFSKALANTLLFPGPGILRSLVSQSEFDADSTKKGWSSEELSRLGHLLDSCAGIARDRKVQLIVENMNEPFFADSVPRTVYGLSDLFAATTIVGLQFDIGNAFRNSSRKRADPAQVSRWLPVLGHRWVTSHLKTLSQGASQPYLTDSPLPVEEVVRLMGAQHVKYATIELLPVPDKKACYDNHAKSIQFLKDKGILTN